MSSKLDIHSTLTLNDGTKIPLIGLGTWKSEPQKVKQAVIAAIECGYRHIDCAELYGNEKEIGEALQDVLDRGVVTRQDLWITSKLWNTHRRPEHVRPALEKTLSELRITYLDQYLIHWPLAFQYAGNELKDYSCIVPKDEKTQVVKLDFVPIRDTWREMEQLVKDGKVKSIGVSNFSVSDVSALLSEPGISIKPAVNQIEVNPYFPNSRLIETMKSSLFGGIQIVAYCPLGRGAVLEDAIIQELAQNYKRSPSQIILRWGLQRGVVLLPKSTTPERIKENIQLFDFELSEEDVKRITNELGKKRKRSVDPIGSWGISVFED
ncbi:hypothetical protein C9374_009116 [Naegleria lovaniensis]|uniref:NADP-dependent oxidoreductase domain-containing protein n=1 Tax=Naegleria lovaniensis TaxID=51637 RepID=A0AA88GIV6_NAELO|nr:uncharacterized protein C9374_009116 [Naegleria lovaniensis]KAG2377600.1 hypothetical protein C9374_009116 [Naegleria lovaniensis]